MLERIVLNLRGPVRHEQLDGRDHLVVPTVMMVEGVWEGSNGPLYYSAEELAKSAPAWNHKPIVVYHPTANGKGVTAADPVIINTRRVGIVLNTRWEDNKLRTECWIDTQKCRQVDGRIIDAIENQKPVEVSTGLFTENQKVAGEFNGKKYPESALNHRPDHLAILPDKVGACSVKDGAGMLQLNEAAEPERTAKAIRRSVEKALAPLGFSFTENEMSLSETSRALTDLLAEKFGKPGKYWDGWITDVYPSQVIFYNEDGKLYSIGYTASDKGVSLKGEPVQVKRKMEYVPVNNESPNPEKVIMFEKDKHIESLIGNGFEAADKEWLSKLPDDQLKKIQPAKPAQTQNASPPPPAPPAQNEDWRKSVPASVLASLDRSVARDNQHKDKLIGNILASKKNVFTKEFLGKKEIEELEGIAAIASADQQTQNGAAGGGMFLPGVQLGGGGNYTGAAGAPVGNQLQTSDDVLTPPMMSFGEKK